MSRSIEVVDAVSECHISITDDRSLCIENVKLWLVVAGTKRQTDRQIRSRRSSTFAKLSLLVSSFRSMSERNASPGLGLCDL